MSGTSSTLWYFSDWLADPCLRACGYAAKGLWIDMLSIAGSNKDRERGFLSLNGKPIDAKGIARLTGGSVEEVMVLLAELESNGVFSRDRHGTIYCRRMVNAEKNRKNGKRGGSPKHLKTKETAVSLEPESATPKGKGVGKGEGNLFGLEDSQEEQASGPRRKPRALIPDDWTPTEKGRAYARENGFNEQEVERMGLACRVHHQNKRTMIADLEGTWRTWVNNELKFNGSRRAANGERPKTGAQHLGELADGIRNGTISIPPRPQRPSSRGVLLGPGEVTPGLLPPGAGR